MRPLTPNSQNYAAICLDSGFNEAATAAAVNAQTSHNYSAEDIGHFNATRYQRAPSALAGLNRRGGSASSSQEPSRALSPGAMDELRQIDTDFYAVTSAHHISQLLNNREPRRNYTATDVQPAMVDELVRRRGPLAQASGVLDQFSESELTRALIARRSGQDFSGAPLPSGASVDSRALGSTHSSQYSFSSGQQPSDSLASSSGASSALTGSGHENRRAAVAPYPNPHRPAPDTTSIDAGKCKHKPGGRISTSSFKGCAVTDDDLSSDDVKKVDAAKARIRNRKSHIKTAADLGLQSTAMLSKHRRETRVAARGYSDTTEYTKSQRDDLAKRKGYLDRKAMEAAYRNKRAEEAGYSNRNRHADAQRSARAAEQGFDDRQQYLHAQRRNQAVLQLGEGATPAELQRIQRREREYADATGADVKFIRSMRTFPAEHNSMTWVPMPSAAAGAGAGAGRPVVALGSFAEALRRPWNAGDLFSYPRADGQLHNVRVKRDRLADEEVYDGDFETALRGG